MFILFCSVLVYNIIQVYNNSIMSKIQSAYLNGKKKLYFLFLAKKMLTINWAFTEFYLFVGGGYSLDIDECWLSIEEDTDTIS